MKKVSRVWCSRCRETSREKGRKQGGESGNAGKDNGGEKRRTDTQMHRQKSIKEEEGEPLLG